MISCLRLISLLIVLTVSAPHALPQKKFCPVPPPSPFKHSGQISTRFDRAANGMRTTLEHPRALTQGAESVYLAATFVHQDPRRPSKPTLDLIFLPASQAARAYSAQQVAIVTDGQPMMLHQPASTNSRTAVRGAASVTLTYSEVSKLTAARKVQVRLGVSEFELTGNHIEALRELASQMAPSPSRWATRAGESVSAN